MAEFSQDETSWDDTDKVWKVAIEQVVTATANLGIPANPYVYKVFIEKKLFDPFKSEFLSWDAAAKKAKIKELLQGEATFVRPSQVTDLALDTLDSLSEDISGLIDEDWYGFSYTKEVVDLSDFGSSTPSTPNISTDIEAFSSVKQDYVLRTLVTEHIPLSGWYYFKHTDLDAKFRDYPAAKKIRDSVVNYLTWYTKTEDSTSYKPLTAGVISVSPSREFSPGSVIVSNLIAGDTVRITISGGSGEYSVSSTGPDANNIEKVSDSGWRIVTNSTASILLSITDASISGLSAQITLNVVEQV
jgi:hypothetical protein